MCAADSSKRTATVVARIFTALIDLNVILQQLTSQVFAIIVKVVPHTSNNTTYYISWQILLPTPVKTPLHYDQNKRVRLGHLVSKEFYDVHTTG